MLVLTRRVGEEVVIVVPGHGEIAFKINNIDRGKISLGITAPPLLEIYRRELLAKVATK